MTLQIDLPPPDAAWLQAQARSQGVEPAEIIRRLVHAQVMLIEPPLYRTPQEQMRAMDAIAATNQDAPILPDAAFDRETLYDERP